MRRLERGGGRQAGFVRAREGPSSPYEGGGRGFLNGHRKALTVFKWREAYSFNFKVDLRVPRAFSRVFVNSREGHFRFQHKLENRREKGEWQFPKAGHLRTRSEFKARDGRCPHAHGSQDTSRGRRPGGDAPSSHTLLPAPAVPTGRASRDQGSEAHPQASRQEADTPPLSKAPAASAQRRQPPEPQSLHGERAGPPGRPPLTWRHSG